MIKPVVVPNTYQYAPDGRSVSEPDTDYYDPCVALSVVAAATKRIRLGTNIYILPLRNPFVTARTVCTLDVLSGGRILLGTGVGWLEPEFNIVGEAWKNRGARTDEIMQIIKRLWTDSEPEFHGKYYDFEPCKFEPKPIGVKLLGSGSVEAAVERAARWCDGWIADPKISLDYAEVERYTKQLSRLRAEYGRTEAPFEITMQLRLESGKRILPRLEDIGVTQVIINPWTPHALGMDSLSHGLEDLDRAAELFL
jgi:probable F420-dependent oxidoreductase